MDNQPSQHVTFFEAAMLILGASSTLLCTLIGVMSLRSAAAYLSFSFAFYVVVLGIAVAAEFIKGKPQAQKGSRFSIRRLLWLIPALSLAMAFMTVGLVAAALVGAAVLLTWVRDPATAWEMAVWVWMPLTFCCGGLLFLFRLRLRLVYGVFEVAAGLAVAWLQVSAIRSSDSINIGFVFAFTTAALFLVVRGMDNIHQGYNADTPDPVARRLRAVATRAPSPAPASASDAAANSS